MQSHSPDPEPKQVEFDRNYISINTGKRQIKIGACHRIPERSFHWRGKPILCYRCLGMYIGFLGTAFLQLCGFIWYLFFGHNFLEIHRLWSNFAEANNLGFGIRLLICIFLLVPFILDGFIQAMYQKYESTNILRLLTGLIGGFGEALLFITLGQWTRSLF